MAEEERDENDGSSYMLFTLVGAIAGPLFILLDQLVDTKASHAIFTTFAAFYLPFVLLNTLSLAWRTWIRQEFEVSLPLPQTLFGRRLPWRLVRVVDVALSSWLALSFVMLCFWIWDGDLHRETHFEFCEIAGCHNIWGAWNMCISQVVALWFTSTTDLHVKSQAAITFSWLASVMAGLVILLLITILVAEGREAEKRTKAVSGARSERRQRDNELVPLARGGEAPVYV